MSNAGSHESGRSLAVRLVKSRYFVHMDKISNSIQESEHLMIREDIEAKLTAEIFDHFLKMAQSIPEQHGTLERFSEFEDVFQLACTIGWEIEQHDDYAKATLNQQDRVISSILISRLGKYQNLALTYPKETVGRSCFLLRGLLDKLAPAASTGLTTGLLWGHLDKILTLEMTPSKLNLELWAQKLDLHLVSMKNSGQTPSDAQLVGRVLAQLQLFTLDRWATRAESIQSAMAIQEHKTWDSLKSRILDFHKEDVRLRRMNQANSALYMSNDERPFKPKPGGKPKQPPYAKTSDQNTKTCRYCKKEGHAEHECRKKKWAEKEAGAKGKPNYSKGDAKGKKMGGTEIVSLVAGRVTSAKTIAVASKKPDVFILDSGASIHATNDKSRLHDMRPCQEVIQGCGTQGPPLTVTEIGTLRLDLRTDTGGQMTLEFKDCYFSNSFAYNLISVPKLLENGHSVTMSKSHTGISVCKNEVPMAWIPIEQNEGGLFCLTQETIVETSVPTDLRISYALPTVSKTSILKQTSDQTPYEFLTEKPQPYKVSPDGSIPTFTQELIAKQTGGLTWSEFLHLIFGHAGHARIYKTLQNMEHAPKFSKNPGNQEADVPCRTCLQTRMKAQRKPAISRHKNATKAGQLIHFDMHHLEVETDSGETMYTVFVDAWSKMNWIFFHKDKKDSTVTAMLN